MSFENQPSDGIESQQLARRLQSAASREAHVLMHASGLPPQRSEGLSA
jgi:hypothetical protein